MLVALSPDSEMANSRHFVEEVYQGQACFCRIPRTLCKPVPTGTSHDFWVFMIH